MKISNILITCSRHCSIHTLAVFMFIGTLAGCSSIMSVFEEQSSATEPEDAVTDAEYQQLAEELLALKASQEKVERLSALESDLMALMTEVAKHSNINQLPPGYNGETHIETVTADPVRTPKSTPQASDMQALENAAQTSKQTQSASLADASESISQNADIAAAAATNEQANGQTFAAHLGYYLTQQAAENSSRKLLTKLNLARFGLDLQVIQNQQPPKNVYMLRLSPFVSTEGVSVFCSVLAQHGYVCKPV